MTECDQRQQEERWIAQCIKGETHYFRPLVQRYERMVRSMIYRLIDNQHEIDDVAQQTMVAAYEHLDKYTGSARFSTWLCQIALNKSRDHLRQRQRQRYASDTDLEQFESTEKSPAMQVEQTQNYQALQIALSKLKAADRELIVFKYLQGHDYETVAHIFGCSVQAAKVRSMRARDKLRQQLDSMGIEI